MWITGFDVESLTYLYNDKPLQKHQLIQTISRVNRKYPGKEYGMIIDYIGIRDNMREALKIYGGGGSVAPTADDVEQATLLFRNELGILKNLFLDFDLKPFLDPNCEPVKDMNCLQKPLRRCSYLQKSLIQIITTRNQRKFHSKFIS